MTVAELHKILDNENKKISLKEYQEILFQLKWDVQDKLCELTKEENCDYPTVKWYIGEMNGFQLALDLSEHIKDEKEKDVKLYVGKVADEPDEWVLGELVSTSNSQYPHILQKQIFSWSKCCGVGIFPVKKDSIKKVIV